MTRRATISVIVPCFRYAHVLEGCIDSILRQEDVDVRVLIVDDHSPDDTAEVAGRLAQRDARVQYRRHAENQGLIATANEGIAWADGDGVVLLSADDLLTPGALARAGQVLAERPGVGMVYGNAPYFYDDRPLPPATGTWRATDHWAGATWIRRRCRTGHNCISSPEVVVRTAVQQQVGGYDARCLHTSDLNMWLRIAAVSDVAYLRGVPQALYRVHGDSMLRSEHSPLRDLQQRRAAFDCFFEGTGAQLPDAGELRALAGRAMARQALWRASRSYDRGLVNGPEAQPVDELVAFALDVYADAGRLREWRGLQLRRRMGEGRSGWFPPFIATGAAHRLHGHAQRRRWRARGV
jgi:glycosyltransferase involved in cell wall biosynthesis